MKKKVSQVVSMPITNVGEVFEFFHALVFKLGVNFHPDGNFDDYIDYDTNDPYFTPAEARALDKQMSTAFNVCGGASVDIYRIALDATENAMIQLNYRDVMKNLMQVARDSVNFGINELKEWGRLLPDNYVGRVVSMNGSDCEILRFDPRMDRPGRHWSVICRHKGSDQVRFAPKQLAAEIWQENREKYGLQRMNIPGWK